MKKNIILLLVGILGAKIWAFSSKSITTSFYSNAVQQEMKLYMLFPDSYFLSDKRYPVMYMLHGYSGNHKSWINYACFDEQLAEKYQTVFIFPDAQNSFYLNWQCQTDGLPHQWEDAIVKDLIPYVDKNYAIDTSNRFIAGLSMGGYGALNIAFKYPNLFKGVLSSAGVIDLMDKIKQELIKNIVDWNSPEQWLNNDTLLNKNSDFLHQYKRTPKGFIFCDTIQLESNDIFSLVDKSSYFPFVVLDCGLQDDHLKANRNLYNILISKKIACKYIEIDGAHEHPYWSKALNLTLPALFEKKQK